MTTTTETSVTTHVHRVYIRATPEAIWEAITTPEWSARYGYGGYVEYDLRPGGPYRARASEEFLAAGAPEIVIDGEVIHPGRLGESVTIDEGYESARLAMLNGLANLGRVIDDIDEEDREVQACVARNQLEPAAEILFRFACGK
jgi:hypothetical protein